MAENIKLILQISSSEPESVLSELRTRGLQVDRVIGNKVIGSVDQAKLEALRNTAGVAEIEPSQRLNPH